MESRIGEESEDRHLDVFEWLIAWVGDDMEVLVDLCWRGEYLWWWEDEAVVGLCFAKPLNFPTQQQVIC